MDGARKSRPAGAGRLGTAELRARGPQARASPWSFSTYSQFTRFSMNALR